MCILESCRFTSCSFCSISVRTSVKPACSSAWFRENASAVHREKREINRNRHPPKLDSSLSLAGGGPEKRGLPPRDSSNIAHNKKKTHTNILS